MEIVRSLHLGIDPKTVIDYISDVLNHPAFIPTLKSVANVSGDPKRPGTSWDWTYVMTGVELIGRAETTEYVAGERFGFKTTGIDSSFTYSVQPEGGGSRLTARVAYEVPAGVLAKVADRAVIARANEQAADDAVKNLKTILER